MSKKGLPVGLKMRHDSHYVEELARPNHRSVGRKIPINLLEPNPDQPRYEIGDLTELSDSIRQKGVLEPILVKPNAKNGTWMIIAGERRWRAANLANLTEVPCIELDIDEKDVAEIALIENLHRKDLTVWEEADGFAYLINKFAYTHEEISRKIGKSRSTVTELLTIAGLPESIRAKCRQAAVNSKSSLLEIARQFDEMAMHDFLDKLNKNPELKRRNARQKLNTGKSNGSKINELVGNQLKNSNNIFNYSAADKSFNLQINFAKNENYNKKDILAALKEAFNQVKDVS